MYASPPNRREAGALQAPETAALPFQHLSLPTGDPVKRHRPRESAPPRLQESAMPHTAPFATSASTAAASSPPDHAPAPPTTSALPLDLASSAELQDPRTLALLSQILPSLTAQGSGAPFDSNGIDVAQAQALLPAIQTLAKYCGVDLASSVAAKAGETFSPLPAGPGPQAMPPVAAAAPQEATESALSTSAPVRRATGNHFIAIDVSHMTPLQREQVGKQNPRDPRGGCWNCKRRKSTTWHEGRNGQGTTVTVCNGELPPSLLVRRACAHLGLLAFQPAVPSTTRTATIGRRRRPRRALRDPVPARRTRARRRRGAGPRRGSPDHCKDV